MGPQGVFPAGAGVIRKPVIAPDTQGISFPDTEIVTNCRIVVKGLCGTYFPIKRLPLVGGRTPRETATIGGVAADCKSVPMR